MAASKRPVLPDPSALGKSWDLQEDGLVTLSVAGPGDAAIAEAWKGRFVDWSWSRILLQSHETFALVQEGEPVALWASEPKRLLQLPGLGACYRLDFLEVHPECRGGVVSYYAAAFAAVRALDAGAEAMVLASLPGAQRFWRDVVGATVGSIHGWHVPGTLLPCLIPRAVMEDLRSDADAAQKA